ncbi:replication factor C small subunit [Archaeoglobus sp.]
MEAEIWVEKYRPKTLDEIVDQEEVVKRLKNYVQQKNIPHLLFAGPPGTGKTATAIALTRDLFGENWRDNFIELNASVSKDTPILVRIDGEIKRLTFEDLDKIYFKNSNVEYVRVDNLEVLTVNRNYKVVWDKVSALIRHWVPKILRVHLEGGGVIELTGNHSVMVLSEDGLKAVKASEIREGDYLLSFTAELEGNLNVLSLSDYRPTVITLRTAVIDDLELNENNAWSFGLYTAEGAIGFRGNTSGQIVYTINAKEQDLANRIRNFAGYYNISVYENYTTSGFNRNSLSAKQIRILSTQLAKFFRDNFYDGNGFKAKNKRVPSFMFSAKLKNRLAYLKGLADGDGYGEWGNVIRISSVSKDLLIDIAWLARISGIESSIFDREVRLIWRGGMNWKKSDLLPAKPIVSLLGKMKDKINGNWRYELRHQLYEGKDRISKDVLKRIVKMVDEDKLSENERKVFELIKKLAYTDLHALKVKSIELVDYNDYVYDVSVPNNEMFFAGNIPILLHNSDERGIDVVRHKIKEFARTAPIGGAPFKIIFLDEADALTPDAQAALRRTMEMYSKSCRFILSCNYISRIIEPIQSRCAVFKFKPIPPEAMKKRLKEIAENEGVKITDDALDALVYIANGDFRKAINALQGAAALGEVVTAEAIYQITATARPEEMMKLIETALSGKFLEARQILDRMMVEYGMSGEDIVSQLFREIIASKLDERVKVMLIDKLGEIDFRLTEGAHDRIQLDAYLAYLVTIGKKIL